MHIQEQKARTRIEEEEDIEKKKSITIGEVPIVETYRTEDQLILDRLLHFSGEPDLQEEKTTQHIDEIEEEDDIIIAQRVVGNKYKQFYNSYSVFNQLEPEDYDYELIEKEIEQQQHQPQLKFPYFWANRPFQSEF